MKKIGILGGSFNPVHNGHLVMAQLAQEKLGLDHVIFMPAACSPHKSDKGLAAGLHRLNMVRLAIAGQAHFSASDLELKRPGSSYTIDTLRQLKSQYPKSRLCWIIGEDNIKNLEAWKDFDEMVRIASFIAVSRLWFNISSTEIRQYVRQKKSIRHLTPDPVIRYINRHHLYI